MCGESETCNYLLHVKNYRKEYYQNNKEKLNKFTKEYYEANRDHILELQKNYRDNNNDFIKSLKNQKNTCECGGNYTSTNKARHMICKKHLKWLEENKAILISNN